MSGTSKKRQVIVQVDENGAVVIEAVGFTGGACKAATAAIEKALGVVSSSSKKPEFYAAARSSSVQKIGGAS